MPWWMMFGEVLRHVDHLFPPDELELFLLDAVLDLIKAHVKTFESVGRRTELKMPVAVELSLYMGASRWLLLAKFSKGDSDGTSSLCGHVDAPGLLRRLRTLHF
jgi:hypothetical protein